MSTGGPVHAGVLGAVRTLAARGAGPVTTEDLEWHVDYEPATEPLRRLREGLGPRPRRAALFAVVGDLCDEGRLAAGPAGLTPTDPERSDG